MKTKTLKVISVSIVLTCILLVTGCSTLEKVNDLIVSKQNEKETVVFKSLDEKETVVFKSLDEKESISTPSSWTSEPELNDNAAIHVCNAQQEKYVIVIADDKERLDSDMTLSDYTGIIKEDIMAQITNATATDIKNNSLNGNKTQYYEISGEIDDLKITYLCMNIESADKFYQILGWTLTPKFEENKSEILDVMNSFIIEE